MQWLLDLLRFNRFSETKFIAVLQLYEVSWVYKSVDVQSYTQVGQPGPRHSYQAVALPPLLDVPHTRMSDACFVVYHDWMTALRPGNNVALLLCSW